MTDIIFHGRKRESYNNPTIESRLKAVFFNLHVHNEMLGEGRTWGRKMCCDAL